MRHGLHGLVLMATLFAGCASPHSGYVFLTQQRRSAPPDTSSFQLSASFYDLGLPDFEAGTVAGLDVRDAEGRCLLLPDDDAGASFDGGRVAASVGGRELVGQDGGARAYLLEVDDAVVDPGTPVRLTVAGGDAVSAAEATLDQPEPLVVTLPTEVPRDVDLTLTWAPDVDADEVELHLDAVLCNIPASDGSVTVDRRLLAQISSGERTLALTAYRSAVQDVDGLPILFRAGDVVAERATVE